jgi:hypothetical protein
LSPGSYNAVVYYKGCSQSSYAYIQNTSNITYTVTCTDANCTNGTAKVTGLKGGVEPYTYKWATGATSSEIGNLVKGTYILTVTDSQGCFSVNYALVKQAVNITVTAVTKDATCKDDNGTIMAFAAGGYGGYTYQYSNGIKDQSVCCLKGGTSLSIIATDVKGCIGTGYATVKSSTPITVTYNITPSSCTAATGSATLVIKGGTLPYVVVWNTYPAVNGITINNMAAGNYGFKITDAAGCVQTGTAVIPSQSIINAVGSAIDAVCPENSGTAFMSVTGTHAPFIYAWSNGATTQSIKGVASGYYSCKVTDAAGCSVNKIINVKLASPVKINVNTTPASCIFREDGKILINAIGGTLPYTYSMSGGQTSNPFTGLATGNYYVYVKDAEGCTASSYVKVGYNSANDSCYCTIKGKVYLDQNNNCEYDSGEKGINHVMMHCEGRGYTYTDANGDYSFLVPTGEYNISETVQSFYPLAPCQNNVVTVKDTAKSGCSSIVNFANIINPIHDIKINTIFINPPVPGFNYSQGFIVQNDGTIKEPKIQLEFMHDGQLNYLNTMPNIYMQRDSVNFPDWYSDTTGLAVLEPGEARMYVRNFLVPVNIPLSTSVNFTDTASYKAPISNWMTDYTPWNNISNYEAKVIGSFDPNLIEVKPVGEGAEGFINTTDSILDYVIHFENTGSYYAVNIVLIDTLNETLDWKSVKPGFSTHNYTAEISETGVLKFTFKNINLPWKASNENLSKGLVTYSVKQKAGLAPLTKINNAASIYFDFNAPINTNTVLNTLKMTEGIKKNVTINGISIYPNPAITDLYVNSGNTGKVKSIGIYDLTGRLIKQNTNPVSSGNTKLYKTNVSGLTKGLYFIELVNLSGEKFTGKFIKN